MKKKDNKNIKNKLDLAKKIAGQNEKVSKGYETAETYFLRVFRVLSTQVDKWLHNRNSMLLVSLVIAILLYVSRNLDSGNTILTPHLNSENTITNVEVYSVYNSELFEITNLPSEVDVMIVGLASDVIAASNRNGSVVADLSGLTEGTHTIKLEADGYGNSIEAIPSIQEVVVTLKKKTTRSFDLEYNFINVDKLDDKFVLSTPVFEFPNVIVRGSFDTLDSIAFIKALIDVSGQTDSFKKSVPLVAYDSSGQPVDVDIIPKEVEVSVNLNTPSVTVPIILETSGKLVAGKAIEKVELDHSNIQIFATEEILREIDYIPIELDLNTIVDDTEIYIPVILPEDVSSEISRINLKIYLGDEETRILEDIPINYRNNNQNIQNIITSLSTTDVKVVGTKENIDAIDKDNIYVYFDLADVDLQTTNELPLIVENNNNQAYVTMILDESTIKIELSEDNMGDE